VLGDMIFHLFPFQYYILFVTVGTWELMLSWR
jgi:hypothetical protein